jgi:hypothetical protein
MKLGMDKIYAKQIIELNEQNKKYIELNAEWIFSINDNKELGRLVREKMIEKINELNRSTEKIKKQIKL